MIEIRDLSWRVWQVVVHLRLVLQFRATKRRKQSADPNYRELFLSPFFVHQKAASARLTPFNQEEIVFVGALVVDVLGIFRFHVVEDFLGVQRLFLDPWRNDNRRQTLMADELGIQVRWWYLKEYESAKVLSQLEQLTEIPQTKLILSLIFPPSMHEKIEVRFSLVMQIRQIFWSDIAAASRRFLKSINCWRNQIFATSRLQNKQTNTSTKYPLNMLFVIFYWISNF